MYLHRKTMMTKETLERIWRAIELTNIDFKLILLDITLNVYRERRRTCATFIS